MRIVITGAQGQLGTDLRQTLRGHQLTALDLPTFDLTDPDCARAIVDAAPEVVIHAGAYTDVDGAERNPGLAMTVNAEGTERVASAAAKTGARLIYISTDYVFDGQGTHPYVETDLTNPLSVYGESKCLGEQRALAGCDNSLVVRTAWLYGQARQEFRQDHAAARGRTTLFESRGGSAWLPDLFRRPCGHDRAPRCAFGAGHFACHE